MTLQSREATNSYLHALNYMQNTKPGSLAQLANRMAGDTFDSRCYNGFKQPYPNAMMSVETAIFVALCDANDVNWRYIY